MQLILTATFESAMCPFQAFAAAFITCFLPNLIYWLLMTQDTTTHKFIRASFWAALNSYSFFILNFIGQIIMAKLLVPEDYGLYAFLLGIVDICIMFLGFSNTSGYINSQGSEQDFDACFKLNIISSSILILLGLIGYALGFVFSDITHGLFFLVLCVANSLLLLSYVFFSPLQKSLDFKKISFYNGACSSGSLAIGIIFAKLHFSYWSFAIRDFINFALLLFVAYKISPIRPSRLFFKAPHKEQLHFGLKISFSRAMELLYYRFSDILIKLTAGKFILGNFYQARTVSYYPIKIMEPFTHQVLFSFLSSLKHDKKLIADRLDWINFVVVRVFLPFVFLMLLFGKSLFIFIYGQKWQLAGTYFEYFSFWIPIASLFAAGLSTCYSLGKQWIASGGYLIASFIFITGMIFFRTLLPPPVFFTIGLATGYAFLLLRLKKIGLPLKIVDTFLLPLFILASATCIYLSVNIIFSAVYFGLAYTMLLLYEKKKLFLILSKIFRG